MTEIHHLSALELAAAYRRGETDPIEAVDHYLERIERHSDTVGAFVTVTADAARQGARAASERLRRSRAGSDDADALPPLYGVPTAFKDLQATGGVVTQFGSVALAGFVPPASDEVVTRVEQAGMISLGKTNTPELGCPCYTEPDPSIAPPARSPYDLTRSAGGSSGGAAAAVSSGLVPIAQASDGGGSIRIPASMTGLVGFKPSRGRVSKGPGFGDVTGLSGPGPMASSVRDSAAMLDVMAGPAIGEPRWAPELPAGETYLGWCDREPGRLRIARFGHSPLRNEPTDPEVLAAYEAASRALEGLGHEVVDIEPPIPAEVMGVFMVAWGVMAAMPPIPPDRETLLRPLTRWLRAQGQACSAVEFGRAMGQLEQVAATALQRLAPFDAVLTPTLAELPAAVGQLRNDDDPAADFAAQVRYTPFAALWNVTGIPAVSLPMGWSQPTGSGTVLPIGVMLGGQPAQDHRLYALAAQVEAACSEPGNPWKRPALPAPRR